MKLKKWLYGLGGVAVVATPAIAVVGCSCSCSSKPSSSSQVFSTYSYEDSTKTGKFVIKGVLYESIEREINLLQPATIRDVVNAFLFGETSVDHNISSIIHSDIDLEANIAPSKYSAAEKVTFRHEKDYMELAVTWGPTSVMNSQTAHQLVVKTVTDAEVTDASVPTENRQAIEKIWGMVKSAIQISQ